MEKKGFKMLSAKFVALVLILCILPVAAFARTDVVYSYPPQLNWYYRDTYVTTYQGKNTSYGNWTSIYAMSNPNNVSQTVDYSYSASSTWSLSLGAEVKKDWISAQMSGNYGQTETNSVTIHSPLGAKKKITVYKRKVTETKTWKTVKTRAKKWYGDSTWTNESTSTRTSTEKHTYWEFKTVITSIK